MLIRQEVLMRCNLWLWWSQLMPAPEGLGFRELMLSPGLWSADYLKQIFA